jgi:hypothetical protein
MPVAQDPTKLEGWSRWRELIAEELREETPMLSQSAAEAAAQELVLEKWQRDGVEASARREAKRAELGELLREHDLTSEVFPEAHKWGIEGDPGYQRPAPAVAA